MLLILLVVSEVSAAVTSSAGGETTSTTIQCYECEWDHQTGCKTGAKVNNNHLRPNCTVCYKNVVQYVQGQAAASGEYTVQQDIVIGIREVKNHTLTWVKDA